MAMFRAFLLASSNAVFRKEIFFNRARHIEKFAYIISKYVVFRLYYHMFGPQQIFFRSVVLINVAACLQVDRRYSIV